MAALGPWPIRRSRVIRLVTTLGLVSVMAGGTVLATNVVGVSGAATTTTLSLSTTAAGAIVQQHQPRRSHLQRAGRRRDRQRHRARASPRARWHRSCSATPTPSSPCILYLGNDIPVSCSPLAHRHDPEQAGKTKGDLDGNQILKTGTVGPPVPDSHADVHPDGPRRTSVITGCTTSGNDATDAAQYPCPPTPAQQAAGDTCVLAIGDHAGDRAIGTILFGTETLPDQYHHDRAGGTTTTTTRRAATTTTGRHHHDDVSHQHHDRHPGERHRGHAGHVGDRERHRDGAGHRGSRQPHRERELLRLPDRHRQDA